MIDKDYVKNEEKQLLITVSGTTIVGKSRMVFLLKKFLLENGFNVKHEVSPDYCDENDFDNQMGKNFDIVINSIREDREITIKEEQLRRNYFKEKEDEK